MATDIVDVIPCLINNPGELIFYDDLLLGMARRRTHPN